jgi:hypothetical protein
VSTGGLNLKANFDKAVKKTSRNWSGFPYLFL